MLISIYLDDMLIQASSYEKALLHGKIAALVLMVLGWSINWTKSNFVPQQRVIHLGFELNTVDMLVVCPQTKISDLQTLCQNALDKESITAHDCERLLGKMESVRPATYYAALFYRPIQRQLLGIKSNWGEGERFPQQLIHLSPESLECLKWWTSSSGFPSSSSSSIRELAPDLEIWTDSTLTMCGAHSSRGGFFQRPWSVEELGDDPHINLLELRAA